MRTIYSSLIALLLVVSTSHAQHCFGLFRKLLAVSSDGRYGFFLQEDSFAHLESLWVMDLLKREEVVELPAYRIDSVCSAMIDCPADDEDAPPSVERMVAVLRHLLHGRHIETEPLVPEDEYGRSGNTFFRGPDFSGDDHTTSFDYPVADGAELSFDPPLKGVFRSALVSESEGRVNVRATLPSRTIDHTYRLDALFPELEPTEGREVYDRMLQWVYFGEKYYVVIGWIGRNGDCSGNEPADVEDVAVAFPYE